MNKTNNLRAYLRDLYEGIVSKKPDASRNPQNFRSEIEAIRTGGELYEVMDASELPEDAPNGSLALVEGEPIPEAYTVSSVDELPTNAVDGSMAIVVTESAAYYKVTFKDEITIPETLYEKEFRFNYNIYTVDGNYYFMDIVYFWEDGAGISFYGSEQGWDEAYISGDGWHSDISEFGVNAISIPDDVDFKEWFNNSIETIESDASVVKQLYIHENGEWVYKCEVA